MAELVMTAAEITADPARWLALRREGITASDVPIILGLTSWSSPFALWHLKAGNLPEQPDNDLFRLAHHEESYVIERWAEVHPRAWVMDTGLYRDGWRLATPDRVIADDPEQPGAREVAAVLECKTVGTWDGWGHGIGGIETCRDDNCGHWLPDHRDVPERVRVQALWQADVLGVPVAHVAALHRSTGAFRWYTIEREPGDLNLARSEGEHFLSSLMSGNPPPVDDAEATTAALKALHLPADPPKTAASPQMAELYRSTHEVLRLAKKDAAEADNIVREFMGDAKYLTDGTDKVCGRVVSKVAGHWVPPHERDYLMPARTRKEQSTDE